MLSFPARMPDQAHRMPAAAAVLPHRVHILRLAESRYTPHCQDMMTFTGVVSVPSDPQAPFTDRLRLAVAAYLARFKTQVRSGERWSAFSA
jgi:hypothetical protein